MGHIEEFYDSYVKELDRLVELIHLYNKLLKTSSLDFVTKKFYSYSSNLVICRINELLYGNSKLREKFKKKFEENVSNVFEEEDPFKEVENNG